MAKRSLSWTEDKIAKFLKEGRGQGEGANYQPWLTIHDVPSRGLSTRQKGNKTGRIHHVLSDLERNYLYLLDWSDHVIDIREQYPLDRERTLQIAEELGYRHPMDIATQTPIVMTTDFLVTVRREKEVMYIARTVKRSEELENKRTIEKFEIEREYWTQKNVHWQIVTEKEIPREVCRNLQFVHGYLMVDEETRQVSMELLQYLIVSEEESLSEAFRQFEHRNFLDPGGALLCFKHLIAAKYVSFDMTRSFSKRMKLEEIKLSYNNEEMRRWAT
ncbi:TnsA endonuclease N-terminal domain-containing protein [Tumebacillus lipolyticus]|uniref:TnsA endonuclease N-terminal domain-containing protein n=1 Tax=Tumebacillus lipolyticus TaxID=1280370 RepID=A0ABW4ZWN5_9BACL